ncbi:MAG: type II toxin-antitoxin system prevent-host-death family antitoxin [Desulfatitalea sp.]|nr:type II toxin-antitoxin system Phd/YefM family antitoxin [Desulfatitalea sp.]NNJ99231.1 type II toxin-antitoxin system prevent-host-death family antitoxin [Desulfatitalea sp.]
MAVLDSVKRTGRPVLVTRHGEPVAMIDPPPLPKKQAAWLGIFKSRGKITDDIITPVIQEKEWQALRV